MEAQEMLRRGCQQFCSGVEQWGKKNRMMGLEGKFINYQGSETDNGSGLRFARGHANECLRPLESEKCGQKPRQ